MSDLNLRLHYMQWKVIAIIICNWIGMMFNLWNTFFIGRSEEEPPSLSSITSLYNYYDDEVPLHWAVVDDGEIAFYSFDNVSFPTQIFKG